MVSGIAASGWKTIDFKGVHCPKTETIQAVFVCVRHAVSYRDLEEIMTGRGVIVGAATLNRRVAKCCPPIAARVA